MRNPTLLIGHAPEVLATLPESSVDLVLTHPPTYGQSDYGPQPTWASGAVEALGTEATAYDYCEHVVEVMRACQRVVKFGGLVMLVTEDNDREWKMVRPEGNRARWTYQWVSRGRYNQIPYHLACLMSESYNYKGEVIWHVSQPPGPRQPPAGQLEQRGDHAANRYPNRPLAALACAPGPAADRSRLSAGRHGPGPHVWMGHSALASGVSQPARHWN
jgi:DNA modification methylase